MDCARCDAPTLSFSIPEDLRPYAPGESAAATICSTCLTVAAAEEGETAPDWGELSDAMPDGESGVAAALMLGALESFAINRSDIQALVRRLEREGTDPHVLVDRLLADGSVDPAVDLGRRKRNLEQLG